MIVCRSLISIDLSGLTQLTTIGIEFMSECAGLISIDLSSLSQLTTIGDAFMYNCTSLKSIKYSQKLRDIIEPKINLRNIKDKIISNVKYNITS